MIIICQPTRQPPGSSATDTDVRVHGHRPARGTRPNCTPAADHCRGEWLSRGGSGRAVCRGEAKLRKDDVLLVQAYGLPLVPKSLIAATVVSGRQERQTFLDKTAGALGGAADDAYRPAHRDRQRGVPAASTVRASRLTVLGKINQHSAGRGNSGIPPAPPPSCLDIPSWQCLAAGRHEQMTVAPTALTRMGSIPRGISIT